MTIPTLEDDRLRVSEIRYRRLFEGARDGILILNAETLKITDANPFMTELLGYARLELIGKELWEIGLFHDQEASKAVFHELQTSGYVRYEDLPLETISGTRREVEFVSNVYDEDGTDVIQCNIRDITERKLAENEISRLYNEMEMRVSERTRQLEAANKELESFSYSVSHDLRAPLRHINGFSLALLEDYYDKLDDTGKNYLKQVREASIEMGSLIDDVLVLARLSRSEMIVEPIDLSNLAKTIFENVRNTDPAREIEFNLAPNLSVHGDKRLISILLMNLLSNAWKFTSKTSNAEIAVGRHILEGEMIFFIRDNGAGFDIEYADKLFGVFQRLHTAAEFEGSGVGLAIVQRVVSRHGGRVWAEGFVDKGATFYFTLPDPGDPKQ